MSALHRAPEAPLDGGRDDSNGTWLRSELVTMSKRVHNNLTRTRAGHLVPRWAHQTFILEENRGMSEKAPIEGKSFHSASMGIDTIYAPPMVP